MVILDTSIIIDHLRVKQFSSHLDSIQNYMPKDKLAISIITVQELYTGKSTLNTYKEEKLIATIAPLKIFNYTYEIAQLAGEIERDCHNPIGFADAAIAATALVEGTMLYSLNEKDFASIPELHIYHIPGV